MTKIDVPDWVVAVALEACGEHFTGSDADMERALTAALGAWVVPTACTEPWRIDYLSSYPRNTVEVSSMDTLSAGDITLYTMRQEKPE